MIEMARFNNGLIYTDEKCIACNKCISLCNISGANISVFKNGKSSVQIDPVKCNHCGKCIKTCNRDARHYIDDDEDFFKALENGEKISAVISPSFYMIYGDDANKILGYLKKLGLDKIYISSYGAEISLWATIDYIKKGKDIPAVDRAFISPNCPALVNNIELFYPYLRKKLIPVHSPMMCTTIYAKKYLNDTNKFAYIGPCIAAKDEIISKSTDNLIQYNVTFEHMMNHIDRLNFNIERFEGLNAEPDLITSGIGAVTTLPGSVKDLLSQLLPYGEYLQELTGLSPNTFQMLGLSMSEQYMDDQPLYSEVIACVNGCYECAGVDKKYYKPSQIVSNINRLHKETKSVFDRSNSWEKNQQILNELFKNLNVDDFKRTYVNRYKQPFTIPKNVLNEIFNAMLKNTEDKRTINCGQCGYKSCKEMASAIACGYNKKENCIHYMQDEMEYRLRMDMLTSIPNRPTFIAEATKLLQANPTQSFFLCSGDINRFKVINDLYGSSTGDSVLRIIAAQLKEIAGERGLCARLGGGSFILFMENTPENLQKFRNLKYFDCSNLGIKIPVTMRFGITYSLSPDEDLMYLLGCATIAMDKQVSSIQNTFTVFTKEYRDRMLQEAEITAQMQSALDNDEFIMYFQPQYSSSSFKIIGAEALCRWKKPDGTILLPSVFIPVAEKNGFIRVLDKIIWQKTFSIIRHWIDTGIPVVPISINISRVSLESDALIYSIKRLTDEYKIPTEYIHFEITESAYISDSNEIIDRINKIKDLGYKIAMDDFGSGYSSLNTLKDISIDILKLDMGFIRDESNMDKGGNIVSSIIRMAHSLDLVTVAEGVESNEKVSFLKGIGCDILQGFYFSRPVNPKQFVSLVEASGTSKIEANHKQSTFFDFKNFFNPDSNESIMFEQFTGPAAILEFNETTDSVELLRCNQKCLRLFGLENKDNKDVRKYLKRFFDRDTNNVYKSTLRMAAVSKKEEFCVTQNKKYPENSVLWIKSIIWKIGNNDASHLLYVLLSDVTDEKISEGTLGITSNQLKQEAESNEIGQLICLVKFDQKHILKQKFELRIIKVNKEFSHFTGYTEEEVLGWGEKELYGMLHPKDKAKVFKNAAEHVLSNPDVPFTCEFRSRFKNKEYHKISLIINSTKQADNSYLLVMNLIRLDD